MVGTPVSTLLGFASVALVLAFVEWSGMLRPPFRWRDWLHTGWLIAAVSLIYPVYLAMLAFVWLYGLRQVPFTRLLGLTALVLGLAQVWPLIGMTVVGLDFDTTNSALLGRGTEQLAVSVFTWSKRFSQHITYCSECWHYLRRIPRRDAPSRCVWLRRGRAAGAPLGAGSLSCTLVSALLFTIRFAIPRTAFFAYPAIYLLAASLNHVIQATANWRLSGRGSAQVRGALSAAVIMLGLLLLVAPSVAALVGYGGVDASFHYWTPSWVLEAVG